MFGIHRGSYQAILLLVALYCAVAIWFTGNPVFFLFDDRPTLLFLAIWVLPIMAWYVALAVRLMLRRRPLPILRIRRYSRLNRHWLGRAALLIGAMALWASAFTVVKVNIPTMVPYYADAMLIAFDRALFGTDPWQLTHALIGLEGTLLLDRAYTAWFFVLVGFMGWLIVTRNARLQTTGLLSLVLIWLVLGVVLATAFSSVGPCYLEAFTGDRTFAPMMAQLRGSEEPLLAIRAMDYLYAMHGKTAYGAGLSAMPSMHVAMAVWFVLVARAGSRSSWLAIAAALYALVIFVGSVHLGWHYAADGILSALVVPAVWRLSQLFVDAAARGRAASLGTLQPCAN